MRRDLVKLLIATKNFSTIKERSVEWSKLSSLLGMGSKNSGNEPAQLNDQQLRAINLDQQIRPEPIDVDNHPVLNAVQNQINERKHSADDFSLNPVPNNYVLGDLDRPREEAKLNDGEKANRF